MFGSIIASAVVAFIVGVTSRSFIKATVAGVIPGCSIGSLWAVSAMSMISAFGEFSGNSEGGGATSHGAYGAWQFWMISAIGSAAAGALLGIGLAMVMVAIRNAFGEPRNQ